MYIVLTCILTQRHLPLHIDIQITDIDIYNYMDDEVHSDFENFHNLFYSVYF